MKKRNNKCGYCREILKTSMRDKREYGYPIKFCYKCKEWNLIGWNKKDCIRCGKEANKDKWFCKDCSQETLIDAIHSISINSREEVEVFVKGKMEIGVVPL